MPGTDDARRMVFRPEVAKRAGVTEASVRRYLETARAHRRHAAEAAAALAAGETPPGGRGPQPGDMPEPDGYDYPPDRRPSGEKSAARPAGYRAEDPGNPRPSGSKSPWWHESTIGPWLAGRRAPGKNRADGGVPRRRAAPRAAAEKVRTNQRPAPPD